jgi:hypothetical protein
MKMKKIGMLIGLLVTASVAFGQAGQTNLYKYSFTVDDETGVRSSNRHHRPYGDNRFAFLTIHGKLRYI